MATEAVIFQQIVDINWDQAIYTASPNNTINVAQFAAKGSGTNIGIALTPKGTGFISARVPDGTAAGGNARGANAVDLQVASSVAARVASGVNSALIGGRENTASGVESACIGGSTCVASGPSGIAGGGSSVASGTNTIAVGTQCTASGFSSVALGSTCTASGGSDVAAGRICTTTANGSAALGAHGRGHIGGMLAVGHWWFSSTAEMGENQTIIIGWNGKTTTNAEVELLATASARAILRANTGWHGMLTITGRKSDGSAVAIYARKVVIKRVSNTTTLEDLQTIGTDSTAGTSISITADDTNDSLKVAATGVSGETWRWQAVFSGGEMAIGA